MPCPARMSRDSWCVTPTAGARHRTNDDSVDPNRGGSQAENDGERKAIGRRNFVKGAGAVGVVLSAMAAAGAFPSTAAAAAETPKQQLLVPRHRIGIGLEEFAFSNQPPADIYSKLAEIKSIGYSATELIEFGGFTGGVTRAKEVRRLLQESGLHGVGNFHGTYTPGGGPNLRDSLHTFIKEDRAAGMINLGCVGWEHDPTWQNEAKYRELARDFNTWGKATKNAGMKFYVHDEAFVFDRDPTTGKILYDVLIEETDPDLVFFCLDVFAVAYRGLDPVDYVRKLERHDRLVHFHIKDWNGQQAAPGASPASTQTDVGQGVIDFVRFFKAIQKPEKYWYIVERELSDDPSLTAQNSYSYLAGLTD